MGDEQSDATVNYSDDSPTEKLSGGEVFVQATNPMHAGVLDPTLAAAIRADHAATVADEDRITFLAQVDADGRILIPENVRASRDIAPGDELLIMAHKIGG